jgi:hypothetical protein
MTDRSLEEFVCFRFSQYLDLPLADMFEDDLTLAAIMARSPLIRNSLDLMEVFARVANALRREHGCTVRLPAFSLDTPISAVLRALVDQLQKGAVV